MMEIRIDSALIRVVQGDITDRQTEAIVNAANNHLWMGSGVAGAIKRKGGEIIEHEAIALGPIEVGDAVVTGAGNLSNKYVIHAAGMGQDLLTSSDIIERVTKRVLDLCLGSGIDSVSFPSIGTGVGGFPLSDCANVMTQVTVDHLKENGKPRLVEFVLWDSVAYSAFSTELHKYR